MPDPVADPVVAPPAVVEATPPPATPAPIVKKPTRRPKAKKPGKPKPPAPVRDTSLPMSKKKLLLEWFPELFWGERVYDWQFKALQALGYRNSRVALRAANGSGKTSKIIAAAIMWHMIRWPGSQTVVTAGVYRQVADVLFPVLRNKANGLGGTELGWNVTENRMTFCAGDGFEPSICNGFSAEDPEKAEGWHARGRDNNLLYIIDEAKGVNDKIFEAMERCQPTRVLVTSSPGGRSGAFYNIFKTGDPRYDMFRVTAFDCPHIKKEWIDQQIAIYGEKSAFIQSMIFAEFGEEEGGSLVLPPRVLQGNISSPPAKTGTQLWGGCDFAAGGDENVICIRKGNAVEHLVKWREKDTMAAIGRFVTEFKRFGLDADHIYADAGGMGIPMCDALREAGWDVHRVNNGAAAHNPDHFANRGTEMWTQYARLVETGKVVVPTDEKLHQQLTTRQLTHNSKGKLMVEPKEKMRERGLGSPDVADAVILAFTGMGPSMEDYMAKYGKRVTFDDIGEAVDMEGKAMDGAWAG